MLFLRLPGYASRLGCGSLTTAAAALQRIAATNTANAAPGGCDMQQFQQLSTFELEPRRHFADSSSTTFASAGSSGHGSRGLATIASPHSAPAEIFDR